MKTTKFFNVLVEHKLTKIDLEELLKLLIIEEDYEYAGLVKEMIDIGHYDENSDYAISEGEELRLSMLSTLKDLTSSLEDIKDDSSEISKEEDENLSEVLKGLEDMNSFLDDIKNKANKREIIIVYPEFKTKKFIPMFKVKADEYIKYMEDAKTKL